MTSPGTVVEYLHSRKLKLGLCLHSDSRGVLYVRNHENREEKVPASRVLFTGDRLDPESPREEVVRYLNEAARRREEIAAGIPLGDLWELLEGEEAPEGYRLEELAAIYFGDDCGADELSGLYRALEADRVWFVRRGDRYRLKPREMVEDSLTRIQVEARREREREELTRWIGRLWQLPEGEPVPPPPAGLEETARRYLTWLREAALHGSEARRYQEVSQLLEGAGISRQDAPFRLLVKAGVWGEHENLTLHRHQIPVEFPPDLVALAAERAGDPAPLADSRREDLRHLHCVTIDDAETTEIDDALSLREKEGFLEVGIHIADASAYVHPGDPLDGEARARATAIYLPDLKVPMLPSPLSEGACSLVAGEERPALSFLATFDEAFRLIEARVTPSLVRVDRRLTYEAADRLMEGDLERLHRLARALREQRRARGAVTVPLPRLNVRVDPDGTIRVGQESVTSPSQVVVSEMMILANRLAAEQLLGRSCPAIFRSQPAPEQPLEDTDEFDPVTAFHARRLMRKGELGVTPSRHHGLALDAYTQVTSPIRRYLDLVVQRQLKSVLSTGEPVYCVRELEEILLAVRPVLHVVDQMERERRNYWVLRYLEQMTHQEMEAVVLQNLPDRHLLQIRELLWETTCPHVPGHPLPPGTILPVRIELVWPRDQVVRVTPVVGTGEESIRRPGRGRYGRLDRQDHPGSGGAQEALPQGPQAGGE